MRKTLCSTILALSCLTAVAPALAQQQNNDKANATEIGMGTGMVIGAIVAGPVGAAVAGIFGAMVGNDVEQAQALKEGEQRINAQASLLSQRDQSLLTMRNKLHQLQQAQVTQVAMTEERAAPAITLQSVVQFQTGAYDIAPDYQQQLDLIAKALRGYPSLQARLTGHADQRGDQEYNQALSMQRAISVKQYLINKGVKSKQVLTVALGENNSEHTDFESTFFDRKVVIELGEEDPALTARR